LIWFTYHHHIYTNEGKKNKTNKPYYSKMPGSLFMHLYVDDCNALCLLPLIVPLPVFLRLP
jgi:hypothetical protein